MDWTRRVCNVCPSPRYTAAAKLTSPSETDRHRRYRVWPRRAAKLHAAASPRSPDAPDSRLPCPRHRPRAPIALAASERCFS